MFQERRGAERILQDGRQGGRRRTDIVPFQLQLAFLDHIAAVVQAHHADRAIQQREHLSFVAIGLAYGLLQPSQRYRHLRLGVVGPLGAKYVVDDFRVGLRYLREEQVVLLLEEEAEARPAECQNLILAEFVRAGRRLGEVLFRDIGGEE